MKKRQLSEFMTHELLFDYVSGYLDDDRRKLVEEELEKSEELRSDLTKIRNGIHFLEKLSDTKLSTTLTESISGRITYWAQIKKTFSFENWPPFVKWTLEAFFVIAAVVAISMYIPWRQIKEVVMQESRTQLILAEISKTPQQKMNEDLGEIEKAEKGNFEDEASPVGAEEAPVAMAQPAAQQPPAKVPVPPKKPEVVAAAAHKAAEDSKKKGFVYRGTLSIVNVEAGTIKLKEKIVELGGRKAGEVELGWRRNEGDYYFHFTIPESKFDSLQEHFKTLGNIKISKDPHPRVMPDGIVRLIITAEESK